MPKDFIPSLEMLVRTGKAEEARTRLSRELPRNLGRKDRLALAAVARRAGVPLLTLRLLAPIVRPPPKNLIRATAAEQTEYAGALIRLGATREALEILRAINGTQIPQSLLYISHGLFTRWDYAAAIPVLARYLQTPLDAYARIVGQVNLASALVHERRGREAEKILQDSKRQTLHLRLHALHGNTLERFAELSIQRRDWRAADAYLIEAERAVAAAGGFDSFFVRKWRAIMDLLRDPKAGTPRLKRFRGEALALGHWETVRECDRYLAVAREDEKLFLKVYFGTPFPSYRRQLELDFNPGVTIPPEYLWAVNGARNVPTARLNLLDPGSKLKFGKLKHRTLLTLSSDFYRPFRIAQLHSEIYPGEQFSVRGSAARIHVAVRDLRNWLRTHRIDLKVAERGGGYWLTSPSVNAGIVVPGEKWRSQNPIRGLAKLREMAQTREFSAAEAARWWDLPRRTSLEILRSGIARGLLVKFGEGPSTRYRFNN